MSNNAAAIIANTGQAAVTNNMAAVVSNTSQAAASAGTTDGSGPIIYIALIVLVAGLVSGIAAYLTQPVQNDPAQPPVPRTPWYTFCLLGVIAAACIPLFLSVVKSALMEDILAGGDKMVVSLLIFLGFCLIAALAARAFLDSLTRRILQQIEVLRERQQEVALEAAEAKGTAKEAAKEASEAAEAVDEADAAPPPEAQAAAMADLENEALPRLSARDRKALQALTKRTYRTRTGIAEDSGIPRNQISELLDSLADRGLAQPTNSPRTGGLRWFITKRGERALEASPE